MHQAVSAKQHDAVGDKTVIERLAMLLLAESLCLGMVIPSLPSLLEENGAIAIGQNSNGISIVTSGALIFASYATAQFITAPLIGWWSDRIESKTLVQISLGASTLSYLVMAMAESLTLILIARALAGCAGSVWLPANRAVGYLLGPELRPAAFAKLGGIGAIGFIIGPVAGGFLVQFGAVIPTYLAAFLSGIAFLTAGPFVKNMASVSAEPANDRRTVMGGPSETLGRYFPQVTALFFFQLVFRSQPFLWPFYLTVVVDWRSTAVGLILGAYALSMLLTQFIATGRLSTAFGARRVCIGGLILGTLVYASMAFVPEILAPIIAVLMGFSAALIVPTFQAFVTRDVAQNQQGQFQGIVTSTNAIASVLGPLLMATLLPGGLLGASITAAPFVAAASCLGCAMFLIALSPTATSPSMRNS
jgi:MFS transporter, DHA1 family, tetracycline resistance protein